MDKRVCPPTGYWAIGRFSYLHLTPRLGAGGSGRLDGGDGDLELATVDDRRLGAVE